MSKRTKNTQPTQQPPAASSHRPKAPKLDATTLALIAAQVAPKRFIKSQDAVDYAYQLWCDSKDLLSYDDTVQAWHEADDKEAENAKLPEHGGPYGLKTFLEQVVGGNVKNRRNRLLEFLKSYPEIFPSPDETIKAWESEGCDRETWINMAAWFPAWCEADLRSKKQAAGRARQKQRRKNLETHIDELIKDLKRDRLRPVNMNLKEFCNMVVQGGNNAVSERRFMDFLEGRPEHIGDRAMAGEALNQFKEHGFTLPAWKEMAFKFLNWRIEHINQELSPQKSRSRR
jgi:hypothetical protein